MEIVGLQRHGLSVKSSRCLHIVLACGGIANPGKRLRILRRPALARGVLGLDV